MRAKTTSKKKVLFIINPNSGKKKHHLLTQSIDQLMDKSKFEVEAVFTKYAGHAIELSRDAVKSGFDIIVAVGGDGTINEVAGQMIHTEVVLGIVPMGSGNGLARHLGIPRNVEKAVQLINQFDFSKIDTCMVNDTHFVSIAGVGFDALVAKYFAQGERRGFLGYFTVVANKYLKYKPKKYKLTFHNGRTIVTRALFIALANSNQFGYNTTIAPQARLTDGLIDVCIVKKPALISLPVVVNLLLLKRLDLSPDFNIIQAPHLTISRSKNREVNIDGEPKKLTRKLNIKINPLSLKVIINKDGQI